MPEAAEAQAYLMTLPGRIRKLAERAGARKVVEVKGASHVVMVSHPDKVAALVVEAAR